MDQGQLVPDSVTIDMLRSEVLKHENAKGFIFDGFPRTNAQAQALEEFLIAQNTSITLMVALEVEENELKTRLLKRAEVSGRADDANPEVIANDLSPVSCDILIGQTLLRITGEKKPDMYAWTETFLTAYLFTSCGFCKPIERIQMLHPFYGRILSYEPVNLMKAKHRNYKTDSHSINFHFFYLSTNLNSSIF
jgi:hypothetical protein